MSTWPPKGQELEDHYFGTIKPRVAAFMQELDEELWKLGILAKTKAGVCHGAAQQVLVLVHALDEGRQEQEEPGVLAGGLPPIPQDTTDRNRTSPLAFTGNKFEFRMLGSSQSISGPNTALNTIMAEELSQFADELEGASDFNTALHDLVQRTFIQHQRIIFNGNGYENAWVEEARKRGLSNLTCTADALQTYLQPKHVELFAKHRVFTKEELRARNEIHLENYCQVVGIEARTMIDMVKRSIFPAVCAFSPGLPIFYFFILRRTAARYSRGRARLPGR